MKTACVIGLGVGMAHICALVRSGYSVDAIVDIDESRLDLARVRWKNEWMEFSEEVIVNPECEYAVDIKDLIRKEYDLIVLAIPPSHQKEMYRRVITELRGVVLLEKPLRLGSADIRPSDIISCEWINHPNIFDFGKPVVLRMSFPKGPEKWKENFSPKDDMRSHLMSILLVHGVEISSSIIGISTQDVHLEFLNTPSGHVTLICDRKEPHGLFINGSELQWKDDLFDRYYSSPLNAIKFAKYLGQ